MSISFLRDQEGRDGNISFALSTLSKEIDSPCWIPDSLESCTITYIETEPPNPETMSLVLSSNSSNIFFSLPLPSFYITLDICKFNENSQHILDLQLARC